MGIDLTLAPDKWGGDGTRWFLAYTRIDLTRDYGLFSQIDDIGRGFSAPHPASRPRQIPEDVRVDWYKDEGTEVITTDPYGSPLTYLTAGELARIDTSGTSEWNQAVFAMIRALPADRMVVLYWH